VFLFLLFRDSVYCSPSVIRTIFGRGGGMAQTTLLAKVKHLKVEYCAQQYDDDDDIIYCNNHFIVFL